MNPHHVTKELERAVAEYTGAPYCVAVTSCTAALTLAMAWHFRNDRRVVDLHRVEIPKRTYVGVPYAIIDVGARPRFRDEDWKGAYQLNPLPVWDSARWFTSGMWYASAWGAGPQEPGIHALQRLGVMLCVSFHAAKTLADTQGGAILLDNYEAYEWLKKARFDGRTEGVPPNMDSFTLHRAWHCYLSPDVATRLLWHLSVLPKHNDPLPNDPYPDLSLHPAFQ